MKNIGFVKLFSSVKLAVILLLIIAVASVIGTVIPQGDAAEALRSRLNPFLTAVFQALQLFDLFHSPWFAMLLGLLCLNLIVCSVQRFPHCLRQYRRRLPYAPPHAEEGNTFFSSRTTHAETARLHKILRRRFGRITLTEAKERTIVHAERGRLSYFSVYVVHAGILFIIAGVLIGGFGGFSAYLALIEGQSSDRVYLRRGNDGRALPFTVRCDRFSLDFYPDGTPKSYRSDLSFLQDGRVILRGPVTVNHPIAFGGLCFYQSDYGVLPHGPFALHVAGGKEELHVSNLVAGGEFTLPEGPNARVLRVEEDFMGMGPAVKLNIAAPEGPRLLWIFQNIAAMEQANPGLFARMPLLDPAAIRPYRFALVPKYYTGLQVNHDPGVPIVAAGSLLIIIGIMAVFFYDHRRVWISVAEESGKTKMTIAGMSNRDAAGLARELARIAREAQRTGEKNA